MLRIYLARHGQDQDNANGILNGHRNEPLTQIGLEQARQIAEKIRIAGLSFDAIYSSPLQRALVTAQTIASTLHGPEPIVLDGLIERDFGVMSGKRVADIETLCAPDIIKTDTITYFLSPPGAETFPVLLQRAKQVLKEVQEKNTDGDVLLVAHGDVGKMIYTAYYQLDWLDILTLFHFGNSELLLLSPDSPPEKAHVFTIEQFNH